MEPHNPAGHHSGNSRNGTRSKSVQTEIGPVQIEVPRDRDGSFEPQLVKKRQRRLSGIDSASNNDGSPWWCGPGLVVARRRPGGFRVMCHAGEDGDVQGLVQRLSLPRLSR